MCREVKCTNPGAITLSWAPFLEKVGQIHKSSDSTAPQGAALARGLKSIKFQTLTFIISPSQSLKATSWRVVELVRDVMRVWEGNPELSTLTLKS